MIGSLFGMCEDISFKKKKGKMLEKKGKKDKPRISRYSFSSKQIYLKRFRGQR